VGEWGKGGENWEGMEYETIYNRTKTKIERKNTEAGQKNKRNVLDPKE